MSVELRRLMVGSQAIEYVITRRERKTLEIAVEPEKAKGKAGQIAEGLTRLDLVILDELG